MLFGALAFGHQAMHEAGQHKNIPCERQVKSANTMKKDDMAKDAKKKSPRSEEERGCHAERRQHEERPMKPDDA